MSFSTEGMTQAITDHPMPYSQYTLSFVNEAPDQAIKFYKLWNMSLTADHQLPDIHGNANAMTWVIIILSFLGCLSACLFIVFRQKTHVPTEQPVESYLGHTDNSPALSSQQQDQ